MKRISEKSISPDLFSRFFNQKSELCFVSLQYGDCRKQVENWQSEGHNVFYDSEIDPLKDMDSWLAQVSACDAIISVANTTIHGAGGLSKPTKCLLSCYADWRWLESQGPTTSYWYPSVGIEHQSKDKSWNSAIDSVNEWLLNGMPYPVGPSL